MRSAIRLLISTEISARLREMKFVYVNNESDWCDENIARESWIGLPSEHILFVDDHIIVQY